MVVASVGVQRLVIPSNRSDLILDPGRWIGRSEAVGFPFGPLRISGFGWHRLGFLILDINFADALQSDPT